MTERPILFNAEMVRAILEGRKTQTRRPIKCLPKNFEKSLVGGKRHGGTQDYFCFYDGMYPEPGSVDIACPYGQPGDRLWVRETFTIESTHEWPGENLPTDGRPIKKMLNGSEDEGSELFPHYRATEPDTELYHEDDCRKCEDNGSCSKWSPSIHMPRWASRILLEITNVRVERIQDMGTEDFKAEGYRIDPSDCFSDINTLNKIRRPFMNSWNKIYPSSWDRNDWVWVVEFRRVAP
jgi:hypothetical protein